MAKFVISLDLELFWGVADSRSIDGYRANLEGVWQAVPKMLALFRRYDIRVTWATVGMLMCRDVDHWMQLWPTQFPQYARRVRSSYDLKDLARESPRLFFARPLVEQIIETPGQELGCHTFSHFYCKEEGTTAEQFTADLVCARTAAADMGEGLGSFVFPRNQVNEAYLPILRAAGVKAYRSNPDHWLYRDGHKTPAGTLGRAVRLTDAWIPLSGAHVANVGFEDGLARVPASFFLRPWSAATAKFDPIRGSRLKNAMTAAARSQGIFHLWWHPHNFGRNTEQNLLLLEGLFEHFQRLNQEYGMTSANMRDLAMEVGA